MMKPITAYQGRKHLYASVEQAVVSHLVARDEGEFLRILKGDSEGASRPELDQLQEALLWFADRLRGGQEKQATKRKGLRLLRYR